MPPSPDPSPAPVGPCLEEGAVQRVAHGEGTTAETAHAQGCAACAARVEDARREIAFLGRARGLLNDDLGPFGAPRLAGYRPLGVISTGAQGVVYQARQESTQRTVAIKVLAAEPAAAHGGEDAEHRTASATRRRMRAEREVEIIARLRHPNIVAVHESRTIGGGGEGAGGGRVALVMEYVDGVPLDQWKPPGAATESERLRAVLRVFSTVCGAVHHAHLNGVIHRDLKPDNILVTAEGRPVVLDFGIAKLNAFAGGRGGLSTTATGDFAGTPAYASPEQVSGKHEGVDALTDVYSLGVILYRLVCRALPYDLGESIFEAARVINAVEPLPPRKRDASVPADLEAVILRALRKEKAGRYQSAAAIGQDVDRFLAGEPVEARSESGWYLLRKAVLVNRRRLGLVGGAVALVVGAGVAVAMSLSSARESAKLAEAQKVQARAEHVRARAVTELLREAMPNADPQRPELNNLIGKGLSRLYYRLETGAFADDPEVDQEIRRLWGGVYTGFGGKAAAQVEYAEVSLRHGLVRLRLQQNELKGQGGGGGGGAVEAEIGSSLHQLAGVLLVRNRFSEAERACAEAIAVRERLAAAGHASDGGLAVCDSKALLARILIARGDKAGAEREADAALAGLETLPPPQRDADLLIASMRALKARLRLGEKNYAAAEPLVLDALVRRLRALPIDDPEATASLNDLADLAESAPALALSKRAQEAWKTPDGDGPAIGTAMRRDIPMIREPARGAQEGAAGSDRTGALGRVLNLQEAMLGSKSLSLVGSLLLQVNAATWERRLDARAAANLRAEQILSERLGKDNLAVLVCIQDAGVTLAFLGHKDESIALAVRSCAIWDAVPEPARDKLMAANAHRYLLLFLALAGRHEEALVEGERAVKMLSDAVGAEHYTVASCQAFMAWSMLGLGRTDEADALSRKAMESAAASVSVPLDQYSHVRFVRGHVLMRVHPERRGEARSLFETAWKDYYRIVNTSFLWRTQTISDLIAVAEKDGDHAGEELWRARAAAPPEPYQ